MQRRKKKDKNIIEQKQSVKIATNEIFTFFHNLETIAINLLVSVCKLILLCFCAIKQTEKKQNK